MSTIDLAPLLERYAVTLAHLAAPAGLLTDSRRAARNRLLRDLVGAGHTVAEIAEAFGVAGVTVLRRCRMAGIELPYHHVEPRASTDGHVPGLVACGEYEATREDCIHEAACLGRLVARAPNVQAARCRPGCEQRQAPDRDTRLRLAMAGGDGYAFPQHG